MTARRYLLLAAGLALFGLARFPFERNLSAELHAAHFMEADLNRDVRAQTGQMEFVAALSGFRSIVGDLVWIRAYVAFEETDWGRLKFLADAATSLQPRNTEFWETGAWHMAWNASINTRENRKQPRETLRIKASREYVKLGEEMLLRGTAFNPDRAVLFQRLGDLYAQRMEDPCRAAWAYYEATKRPDVRAYVKRAAVYQLAKCPGHEAEALALVRTYYNEGPMQRLPTLLTLLDTLQKQLNVPAAERIDITKDMEEATPGRRLKK